MTKLIPPPAPRPHDLLCGLFLCASLWLSVSTLAAPFARQIPFTQPDGTTITLWGQGDEFQAVFETLDGYTVAFNHKTKSYEYADLSTDGSTLLPSGLIVGRDNPAAATLAKHIRITPLARHKQASERFQKWDKATGNSKRWASLKAAQFAAGSTTSSGSTIGAQSPPSFATTGVKVGLTLLVDFSDDPATIPQADFDGFCNGDNYTGYGNSGSVKQYYYDNSNHLLIYSNVVTLYVRVPNTKAYYNDTTKDSGTQANLLIKDAIDAMKALTNYNSTILPLFAPLTVDGSSYVVACNVFYAGGNGGVWSYGLWPHSWSLYDAGAQDLGNGKKVYDYQITNIGNSLELGTFCHENGHMLCGYPDIYDYGYDSYGGAGAFCLMDYNPSEINPVQICAYLKRASGWATTTELTSLSNLTATVSSSGTNFNHFYRYAKPGVSTEYFLVENRQKAGRDTTLPAAGIAIWHVDELGNKDNQSTKFNSSHANY